MLAGSLLQCVLQPVKDHIEELLSIFLLGSVRWRSIEFLEGEAERLRVKL